MKPTKHCMKRGGREGGGKRNIMVGVNLFKLHYTHVWNYHKETIVLLRYTNLKDNKTI
jgi:hypothetical protein